MITVLPWVFGCAIIEMMLPKFAPLLSVIKQILFNTTTLTVIAAAVIALFAFAIIRAVHKRRKFYSELSSLCKNYGITVSPVNHLLMSVFKITTGENFNITANGKRYSCKLIGALSKNDPLAPPFAREKGRYGVCDRVRIRHTVL